MRILFGTLASLLLATHGQATDLFDQLRTFNPYWEHRGAVLCGLAAQPIQNDVGYVRMHLAQVLNVLNAAPVNDLSHDQRASRRELLEALRLYAGEGRFPINYHRQERTPVFIDEHDTFCAVGHLMRKTGHEAMARRIAATNNLAWVKDIDEPGLADWQLASGFGLDELKLIQGAYDFYLPDAFLLPDKYEVPQKPEVVVRHFDGKGKDKVWCYGEGTDGVLHGRWEQNYTGDLPWIVGYFEHGKRSGRWKEYYKGTDKLCRTEHWRDDKLNGVRTRYDRDGRIIETILFRNGQAVTKTNIDHDKALRWVRSPLDSTMVYTEVFTEEGGLIAAGNERIHNPEGLLWFQNIELTALNTYAITARDGAPRPEDGVFVPRFDNGQDFQQIPGSHQLVQYRKEGEWAFYKDYLTPPSSPSTAYDAKHIFINGYGQFGPELYAPFANYEHLALTASYDSMHVSYRDGRMMDLYGFSGSGPDHLQLTYHPPFLRLLQRTSIRRWAKDASDGPVKRITRLDVHGNLIGMRVDYDLTGRITRMEHFLVPYRKEGDDIGFVD